MTTCLNSNYLLEVVVVEHMLELVLDKLELDRKLGLVRMLQM